MALTRYGYDVVIIVTLIVLVGSFLSWQFIEAKALRFGIIGLFAALMVFTLNFFRDPERAVPDNDAFILAPADGRVILVKDVTEDEYLKSEAVQVSIFMSPLDVHVNRYPISGTVGYFRYFPGEYLVAYEDKASVRNERTHIGIENGRCKVLFKQIAGFVARRIVAPVRVGDNAKAGERFGMIRFGSRVDVLMPKSVHVKVKVGDRTVAGETVIAVIA